MARLQPVAFRTSVSDEPPASMAAMRAFRRLFSGRPTSNLLLAAAYSSAKLGKENLCFSRVSVSRGGSFICCLDVSVRYQTIPGFSAHFLTPQPLTQDCQFFVGLRVPACRSKAVTAQQQL